MKKIWKNEQEFWTEQECIKSTKTFEICSRIKVLKNQICYQNSENMSNASHPLSLSWTCSFLKNHRCMMYYVCFLPLRLCMMFPSSLTLWTTVVIITFVVKLSKETKQRTSKMTLSIWQEKIETKWLENSPQNKWSGLPGSLFNPEPLKGYLLPWTIRAIDRKCKTSSQLSQRSILLF